MRMNEGVEWAAHCAGLLAALPEGASLPAARLAEFHGVPAPYLAKTLQALKRAGIVRSTTGRVGGYRLGRPATDITLRKEVEDERTRLLASERAARQVAERSSQAVRRS